MKISASFLCLALLITGCATGKINDAKNINGTWTIATAQFGGKPFPDQIAKAIVLKMADGKYEVKAENVDQGTYVLDTAASPKALDIYGVEGPNSGKHIPCIYQLNGDELKVCYQLGTGPRPADFSSPAGTKIFLVTYHRQAN